MTGCVIALGTFELFGSRELRLGDRVQLRSLYRRPARPSLLLLEALLVGLLLRSLPFVSPFRLLPLAEGVRLGVLDLDPERGEMVRRGADLVLEGVWDLANADVC